MSMSQSYLYQYSLFFFFFNDTATTEIYTLSLHDALPISHQASQDCQRRRLAALTQRDQPEAGGAAHGRSEEHTSELQSPCNLVCRLLLEKKKKYERSLLRHCEPFKSIPRTSDPSYARRRL